MAAHGMTTFSQTTTPGISTARSIMKKETAKKLCLKIILTEIFAALVVPPSSHCEWGFCECNVGFVKIYVSSCGHLYFTVWNFGANLPDIL